MMAQMLDRLRARPEWKFFGVLLKADRRLAIAWWAALGLRGLLPALFAIAMGALVGAVQRGNPLGTPLIAVGTVFVLLQITPPFHHAVGANLGSRVAAWLYDQLTIACVSPPGMGHLEDPRLTTDLAMARDFDLGISVGPGRDGRRTVVGRRARSLRMVGADSARGCVARDALAAARKRRLARSQYR
jgi:ATP-binding cassette, subfamily B, bacterial